MTDSGLPPTPTQARRRPFFDWREDRLGRQRRTRGPGPGDWLLVQDLREQIELLLEQHFVLREVVAEQRKRLGERAAAENHFGAAVRQRIQGREPLVDANRVVRAEHGDRGAQVNVRGLASDRRQHHLRRGHGEVLAVVLAAAEAGKADLIGQHGLGDDVAEDLRLRQGLARAVEGHVAKSVEAQFDDVRHIAWMPAAYPAGS